MLSPLLMKNINFFKYYLMYGGFWPFIPTRILMFQQTVCALLLSTMVIPFAINVYFVRSDLDDLCEALSLGSLVPLSLICFIYLVSKREKIIRIFEHISEDYEIVAQNKKEFEILQKTSKFSRMALIIYMVYTSVTEFFYILSVVIPIMRKSYLNENGTGVPDFAIALDFYFFDRSDYVLFSLIHVVIGANYCIHVVLCIDTLLFAFSLHTCGMFKVLRYKLLVIMVDEDTLEYLPDEEAMYKKARSCVVSYIRILELIEELNNVFSFCLLFTMGIVILLVSFHGSVVLFRLEDVTFVVNEGIITVAQVFHLFFNCMTGQFVNNESSNLKNNIYEFEWYNAPKKIQKLILLMSLQGGREINLNVGKTLVLSFDFFATIIKTIFSYLNLLNSRRGFGDQ